MKERPIIFSTSMVKKILSGEKTQTRRIIKPQFSTVWGSGQPNEQTFELRNKQQWKDAFGCHVDISTPTNHWKWLWCPYGKAGDRLWVRESWADVTCAFDDADEIRDVAFKADNSVWNCYGQMVYLEQLGQSGIYVNKWKPSIHMPKFASRINLEITNVRVERLQDISEADAQTEGMPKPNHYYCDEMGGWEGHRCKKSTTFFEELWNEINAKRGFGWESNPWVWVIEFRKI